MPKWGNGRPPVYKQEMEFESLKLTEVDEYGTIAGSSPALGTIKIEDFLQKTC